MAFPVVVLLGGAPLEAEVYLFDGFHVSWRDNPHGVNHLGVELRADGTARTELTGGPWSDGRRRHDAGRVEVWRSAFDEPGVRTIDGSTNWTVAAGRMRRGANIPATSRVYVVLDLDAARFGGCRQWAVLLRGFDIDTDVTHPDGFTVKGFAAGVAPPTVVPTADGSAPRVTFFATLRVEAGRLPSIRRRPDAYTVRGRIHYTLIGLESGHVTRAAHASAVCTRGGINRPLHSATERIAIEGRPGYSRAALGLTGFDIRLNPTKNRFGGRYLRDLWVHNGHFVYEPGNGRMTFDSSVGFSNRSRFAYTTTTISEAHFALLQTGGTDAHPPARANSPGRRTPD